MDASNGVRSSPANASSSGLPPPVLTPAVPTPPSCLGVLDELLQLLQGQLPDLQPVVHTPSSSSSSSGSSAAARKPTRQQQAAAPAGHAALPAATLPTAGATLNAVIPAQSVAASNQIAHLAQPLYHVSLSRTVPLRLDQIQPLVEELRSRLRCAAAASGAAPCLTCLPAASAAVLSWLLLLAVHACRLLLPLLPLLLLLPLLPPLPMPGQLACPSCCLLPTIQPLR